MSLLLSFSFDRGYRHGEGFRKSVLEHVNVPHLGVALGDWGDTPVPDSMVRMPDSGTLFGRPIVQHGSFLPVLRQVDAINDGTVVLFVDADAVFQRPFTGEEINHIEQVGTNNYLVGVNRIHDRPELWQDEAPRILPTESYHREYRGQFDDVPVFNTGFLAMHTGVYQTVYHRVVNFVKTYGHWFQHHAATQIFLCAAMHKLGLRHVPAPLDMAAHGHCGTPPGVTIEDNKAFHNGRLIAYAHALCGL
jgi:hypothetical protein